MTQTFAHLITRRQLAARYDLTDRRITQLIREGRITVVAHHPGHTQRFDPRQVTAALGPAPTFAANSTPPPHPSTAPPASGGAEFSASAEGELMAGAFRLFDQGKSVRDVVMELQRPLREVQALERAFHGWGDDASLATFLQFARAQLATVALPLPTTVEEACHLLRDLVAAKARVELEAVLRTSAPAPSATPAPRHHDDESAPPSEGSAPA